MTAPSSYSSTMEYCLFRIRNMFLSLLAAGLCCSSGYAQILSPFDKDLAKRMNGTPDLHFSEKQLTFRAPFPGWSLGAVSGVAAGLDGNLYVIQRGLEADPILVFDRHGNLLRSWGKGDFILPHSLRIDSHGNVWAIDAGVSKVIEYTSTGKKLLTIAVERVPETGSPFRGVTDLAFAPNGRIFLTDGYGNARVLEYTAKGHAVREWGHPGTGPGEFNLPHAIQIGRHGIVYIADRENGRIEEFSLRGTFLREIDGLGRCYSLALRGGALWATMGPRDQDPGAPGWLVEMDPDTGRILGHLDVPDQRAGHALDILDTGEPVLTAGSGLLMFQHAE